MRAAWFEKSRSGVDVFIVGQQPTPAVESGQILVRIMCSGVKPPDINKCTGLFSNLLDDGLVIPHGDAAMCICLGPG